MPRISILAICLLMLASTATSFAGETAKASGNQTIVKPAGLKAPLVVIYTLSTCHHCKEAKEYLINNNIPFTTREVDTDEGHMATLMKIYDSMGVPEQNRGVPLLVIDNRIRIQGLNKEKLQDALKEVTSKPK